MAYTPLPANLYDYFNTIDQRLNKLELAPSSAQTTADTANATASTALANAATAYSTASTAIQKDSYNTFNASNQLTAINGNGITVYSGSLSGPRVVLNSTGLAGTDGTTTTFSISASTGNVSITGASFTSGTIYGGSLNINGNCVINTSGYLTATGATITGTINASAGYIGSSTSGFTIGTYGLSSSTGSVQLLASGQITTSGQVAANTANIGGSPVTPTSGLGVYGDIQGNSQAVFGNMTSAAINTSSYYNVAVTSTGRLTRSNSSNSSRRFKDNITYFENGNYLNIINQLKPASYTYKPEYVENPDAVQYGLIAEDVDLIDKKLVGYDDKNLPNSVIYSTIPIYLIKAVQELSAEIQTLKGQANNGTGS